MIIDELNILTLKIDIFFFRYLIQCQSQINYYCVNGFTL